LLGNGSVNTPVARQHLPKHTKIPKSLQSNVPSNNGRSVGRGVFYAARAEAIYNEDQLQSVSQSVSHSVSHSVR
jgi:hypothetical protein